MKNLRIYNLVIVSVVLCTLLSCKDNTTSKGEKKDIHSDIEHNKDHVHHNHIKTATVQFNNAQTGKAFKQYIDIKTALVHTDAQQVKASAKKLAEITENTMLKTVIDAIIASNDIEEQRRAFVAVTTQMEAMLRGALSSGEVYKQYCPMAFNNEGGYWLSTEKEIRNPYFGDQMLKCGSVSEIIK
ncbi:DUF3347 domain-containing protein [Aquimarina longa]|uniref:DUF3347 domain-containing protein n=1 Tax=Aquimarina longa TaxID=1080221 RepID=UPI0007802D09|nr:DUF3347 domain-containing protein [Aquimarina longa]